MSKALAGLLRYIVPPTVAKRRPLAWPDAPLCPDHQRIVVTCDDDTTFGILHSRFHQAWSLREGTGPEDRSRCTPATRFGTVPFPEGHRTGPTRGRLRRRSTGAGHSQSGAVARRILRPRPQPARVGGVGRGPGSRLPRRTVPDDGTREVDSDRPLQFPSAVARRCPCPAGRGRRLRLARGHAGRRRAGPPAGTVRGPRGSAVHRDR